MHDHAGGLVDDEDVVVLVDDGDRQRLGPVGATLLGRLQRDVDPLAGTNALRRTRDRRAVDLDPAPLDQLLQVAARELGNEADDGLVEPLAVQRGADRGLAALDGRVVPVVAIDVGDYGIVLGAGLTLIQASKRETGWGIPRGWVTAS